MKRQRVVWLTHAVLTSTAAVLLLSGPAMAGVAQARAEPPAPKASPSTESKPAVPADQVPLDRVPPADRDKVLPNGWRASADRVWTTSGDANGFHILTATAGTGYTWETAASLSEPGFDVDRWIGNACVTGSGRRLVVVYAPRTFTNKADLFDRGGFTAVVDLKTHRVKKLPVQSSLAYFNPGCGAGETAVVTQFDGEQHEDPADTTTRSRMFIVDAAARTLSKPIVLNTELSSPVPVRKGIVAAAAGGLVSVSSAGKVKRLARATGVPFRLAPDSAGGVVFMDKAGDQARVKRAVGRKVTELARGPAEALGVTRGDAGRAFITGQPSHVGKLPAGVRRIAVTQGSEISTRGGLAVTDVKPVGAKDPRTDNVDPTVAKDVAVTATVTATGKALAFVVSPHVLGPEAIAGRATHPKVGVVAEPAGKARAKRAAAGSPSNPVESERYCAVPRNDVANQAVQPKPRNVEWAVDQAIVGKLNQVASRPANWKGYGLPAYAPQSLFPAPALLPAGRVPAQIMLGIIAQESNMWQAAKYALPGVAANPLIGNYYGRDIYNSTSADDWDIKWEDADCGYGLTQATDGMRLAGREKPGETALPYNTQRAVAVDYTANIAYGLKILQEKWNQTYSAGLRVHNADPSALENWFYAVWAYNSGFYPDKHDGSPWGVGWLNNPINPRYDPLRHPFMSVYEDAKNPQNWPYPEKVMGWAANPITATESPGVEVAGYRFAWWTSDSDRARVKPPKETFCTASDNCDPSVSVQPNDPDVINEKPGPCLHKNAAGLYDLKCWAHDPVGWKNLPGAVCNTCGHETLRFDPGYPWCSSAGQTGCESDGISYPVYCNDEVGLPEAAVVVDDVAVDAPSPRGCAAPKPWRTGGSFRMSFAGAGDGTYPSKIDIHQVGGGYRGHYWRGSTRTSGTEGGKLEVTGTWRLDGASAGKRRVQVFVPEFGAWTEQAKYTINLGNGETRYRVINQTWQQNRWVDLGVFNFRGVPEVSLTTEARDGTGDDSIIFDAVAFSPEGSALYGVHNTLRPDQVDPGFLPENVRYVAMGDSYSSGEGVSPYDHNSDLQRTNGTQGSSVNACHRSQSGAYPHQVSLSDGFHNWPGDGGLDPPLTTEQIVQQHSWGSLGFIACSGANTTAVTRDAVNSPASAADNAGHTDWGKASYRWGELTQVEQGWLDEETTHVSISIGGNDARFTDILFGCIASLSRCSDSGYKLTRKSNGVVDPESLRDYETKVISDWLPAKLKATYRAIHRAAPNAEIVVVGYPQMFPDEPGNGTCWNLAADDRLFLNVLAGRLSIATANAVDAVHDEGVNIRYADSTLKFRLGSDGDKHWACDGTSGKQWINGITDTTDDGSGKSTPGTGSWHPTAAGQRAIADLLNRAVEGDSGRNAVKQRILDYVATKSGERWVVTDRQADLAAQRCLDLVRRGGLVGDPCMHVPILFPSVFDAGGAAQNDDAAIVGNPRWVLGNYASDAEKTKAVVGGRGWIDNGRYGQTKCPSPRPDGTNCDEFPFFASEQGVSWDFWTGGDDSPLSTRLRIVPAAENRADGRLLGNIVSSGGCDTASATYSANAVVNGAQYWGQLLSNGTPFLTIPLIDAAENVNNKSFYVC